MPDSADSDLRSALLQLLAVDSYPKTERLLRADARLLGAETGDLLARLAAEAERGDLTFAATLPLQLPQPKMLNPRGNDQRMIVHTPPG